MANTVTKSFEADRLHHPIVVAVSNVPITPCNERRIDMPANITIGKRQYPRTLITQPTETPVILMRFNIAYMERQPKRPTP